MLRRPSVGILTSKFTKLNFSFLVQFSVEVISFADDRSNLSPALKFTFLSCASNSDAITVIFSSASIDIPFFVLFKNLVSTLAPRTFLKSVFICTAKS